MGSSNQSATQKGWSSMLRVSERVFGVTSLRPGMASGSRIHTEAWHFMPILGSNRCNQGGHSLMVQNVH